MLTVTESAAAHLAKMLDGAGAPEGVAARIKVTAQGGLRLSMDNPRPDDETFEHGERTVLLLDRQTCDSIGERTLGLSRKTEGDALTLE